MLATYQQQSGSVGLYLFAIGGLAYPVDIDRMDGRTSKKLGGTRQLKHVLELGQLGELPGNGRAQEKKHVDSGS